MHVWKPYLFIPFSYIYLHPTPPSYVSAQNFVGKDIHFNSFIVCKSLYSHISIEGMRNERPQNNNIGDKRKNRNRNKDINQLNEWMNEWSRRRKFLLLVYICVIKKCVRLLKRGALISGYQKLCSLEKRNIYNTKHIGRNEIHVENK